MATAGCLIGSGPDLDELRVRTADFVVRLFGGGNPAELPIEQPTRFQIAINLRAAASLGLTLAPAFLARVDEVIE